MSTALQSEDRAFESLYRLHRPLVYAYTLSTLRHPADAEDATQTTFLNAYSALHRGVAPRDDLQWLLAIARNVCRDRFRDAKRRPKEEPLSEWMRLIQPEQPDYTVAEICKEIGELHPRYRQILLLREFEGRSYREISAELGVSEGAVQTLLARARALLREELELGMTCTQARRVSLRHLNGVALRDERRALQRHLRRCADCATFVGRTPRTPVARMLWLVWLPYRRIMTVIAGASAVPGSTVGVGVLTKLATVTVVGGAAVTVGVKEVGDGAVQHTKPVAGHTRPAVPAHRLGALPSAALPGTAWAPRAVITGRPPLTHASRHPLPSRPQVAATSVPVAAATATPAEASPRPATGAPAPALSAEQPDPAPAPPPTQETAPVASPAAAAQEDAAAPAGNAPAAAESTSAAPASDSPATAPPEAAPPSPPASSSPAPDEPPASIPAPPSGTTPTPVPAHGNGNAVGQDGTPPGQANKPDAPAHGRP